MKLESLLIHLAVRVIEENSINDARRAVEGGKTNDIKVAYVA